jgi:hypothetical protein
VLHVSSGDQGVLQQPELVDRMWRLV